MRISDWSSDVCSSDLPAQIRANWIAFLLAQVAFGAAWSGAFSAAEWTIADPHIVWGWPLIAALAFVAVGPAIIALRCWGLGVKRGGPRIAGCYRNLTPLVADLM